MTANKIEVGAEIEMPEGEPGVITFAEHPCPDIFYISVRYDNISPPRSYYLVAALYQHHFSYVANSNLLELSGRGMTDMISHLRRLADFMYGVDIDDTEDESLAEQREKNCLVLSAGAAGKEKGREGASKRYS